MSRHRFSYWIFPCFILISVAILLSPSVSPSLLAQSDAGPGNLIIQGATKPSADSKPENSTAPQEPVEPEGNGLNLKAVQDQLEAVQKLDLPEDQKKKLTDLYNNAVSLLQEVQSYQARAPTQTFDPQKIEQEVSALKKIMAEEASKQEEFLKPFQTTSNPTLDAIDSKLTAAKQQLAELQQKLIEKENELKAKDTRIAFREDRIPKILMELATVDQRLEAIKKLLQEPAPAETPITVVNAQKTLLRAEQQKLLEQRKYLSQEMPYYTATKEWRTLEKQVLQKEVSQLQRQVEMLQKQVVSLEKKKAAVQVDELQVLIDHTSEPLKPLAKEIAETIRARNQESGFDQMAGPLEITSELREKLEKSREILQFLQKEQRDTQDRLDEDSRVETLAPILNYQRSIIPSIYQYEEAEITHHRMAIEKRSKKLEYELEEEDLVAPEDEIFELLGHLTLNEEKRAGLETEARSLLSKKKEALATLKTDYDNLLTVLTELSKTEGELVVLILSYQKYLDKQSLWVPVAPVIQIRDLKNAHNGLAPLVNVANWRMLGKELGEEILSNPTWTATIVIALILFILLQTRLKRRLMHSSKQFSENFIAPFELTREAFLITLILPIWIPSLIWLIGNRLLRVIPPTDLPHVNPAFVPGFGSALISVAFVLCVLRLTRYLVRPNGLGEVHFRWPKQQLFRVRRNLHWFTLSVVPLVFVITMIYQVGTNEDRRSLGRLLMLVLMLATSWFLYRVLMPAKSTDERSVKVELSLWKKTFTYGPCCVPLFFALLSVSGYTFTANVLMGQLILTSGVLLVLVMLNELGYRWVYIARGKLALEQAKQRQEARAKAEASKSEGGSSESPSVFDPKSAGVDLASINAQTRQLLSTTFRLAVFVSMWMIWGDVTPQIDFLNWTIIGQTELVTGLGGEGEPAEQIYQASKAAVTVGDLILLVLTIAVTIIASKNLPGLLEITVLQNLPLDTGIRYAIGSIARYVVMAIGITIGCGMLGIGMTQVSILLGGLAVGLGFGLQEMFANFVSGIILLFEQPLRVGDIVTLGNVTGTVTRIRIRATTITDWDRKEFIVPNKEFIVGQFNNWTLSDTINRIVILVGVAYGSDTEKARHILLKICADHPEILDEPISSAVFDGFGDSTLNFTVRCFLPKLENRLQTIHELHTAIDQEFRKADIEIAFPQRDLHLRSIDQINNALPLTQEKVAGHEELE
ncbi:mechanosensitive ion channel [Planctomycetaceae bacterium]|jgi:potassium-dependent mechanosensitive channel|nr:mechanosensitive ion channel [Planctomycetaceae bacterium]